MKDEYVQVNVRMTRKQREQLKDIAEEEDTSMNQFIIDSAFNSINDRTDSVDDRTNDSALIEVLKQQLDKKDEQLDNKDEQIKKLQNILDQQQQLSLKSSQQIEYLQIEIETKKKKEDQTDEEKKQGFFSRLFNTF